MPQRKGYTIIELLIVIGVIAIVVAIAFQGCNSNIGAKYLGGTQVYKLEPGQECFDVTWKGDSLWIAVRPRLEHEKPDKITFMEKSQFGAIQGKVIIIEQ
jgi:prepilin-type N-terminal cleavage/methylation domain-containing protein